MAILFVDHLTVIDCAYLEMQRGLVGESWIVDLELEGDLDAQSMVLDFGEVKRRIKRAIDQGPDHTLLVPRRAQGLRVQQQGHDLVIDANTARGTITLEAPAVSVTLLDDVEVSAAAVAAHCETLVRAVVPASVRQIRLRLRNEQIDGAYYHYVHGLKKHDGACQRIAHGHRSRIEIYVEGERDAALEAQLASSLRDAYIVSRDDVLERTDTHLTSGYRAPEGHFKLRLPQSLVTQIDSDSTVECLADWLLAHARRARPDRSVTVKAFEGIRKGALAHHQHPQPL